MVTIMEAATALDDDRAINAAVNFLFKFLESLDLRSVEPSAWILAMRTTLNMAKHPNAPLARIVTNRLAASKDRDIVTYMTVDKLVTLVPKYQPNTLKAPMSVSGQF